MNLRAPAYPLLNVDPYFSVWSFSDNLNDSDAMHWTGKPNTIRGLVTVDGETFTFMGKAEQYPAIAQTSVDLDALSTFYTFKNDKATLRIVFTSPRFADQLYWASVPTAIISAEYEARDGKEHRVSVRFEFSEELCLNEKGQHPVSSESISVEGAASAFRMGSAVQNVLWRSGDDVRIDWGYFCVAAERGICGSYRGDMSYIFAESDISAQKALFCCAYDDIYSLNYFGENIKSYWNRDGETIEQAMSRTLRAYDDFLYAACESFSDKLFCDASRAGGDKYAEILQLAWRQVMAAHKIGVDADGEIVFISKECFSNGCAATVDVSYPSVPMFLIYNPELVKGMLRPIFKYAADQAWPFDFAPHDAGQYPLIRGQVYNGTDTTGQMPLEECGNMLVMVAAVCIAEGSPDFAARHLTTLGKWADYLVENGDDPANQLCTDDFAGHMAHNCNLTIKAVMGIAGFSIVSGMLGLDDTAAAYRAAAEKMAASWVKRASNGDGSYRLAFDRAGTYSMKYNAVWDKLFGTGLFPREVIESELASNFTRFNPYGMPLDNRAAYTKSDWMVWTATMASSDDTFRRYIEPLWDTYNYSRSRIPMTDWYDTVTGDVIGFRHRSVQGGLFIKLLDRTGKMKLNN